MKTTEKDANSTAHSRNLLTIPASTGPVEASYMKPGDCPAAKPLATAVATTLRAGEIDLGQHYAIVITNLPVVSRETLEQSSIVRICHILKHIYLEPGYDKHSAFIKKFNHGKSPKRPKTTPSFCVYYQPRYVNNADGSTQLVIDLLPSASFPSGYTICHSSDSRADRVTKQKSSDGSIHSVYWRLLTPQETGDLLEQFTDTCVRLIQCYLNSVWKTRSAEAPDFFAPDPLY